MKNDQENPIYPSVLVSCMFKKVKLLFSAKHDKALFKITNEFGVEPLVQNGSNPSGCSCISPTHSYCHVMIMHHIVALN